MVCRVVFGTLTLFESLIDGAFFWLPFFYVVKIAFLVWCFHPSTKGALVVYSRVLQPLFSQVQEKVEQVEKEVETKPPGGASVTNSQRNSTSQNQRQSTSQKGR
jgi:hypothetical protein